MPALETLNFGFRHPILAARRYLSYQSAKRKCQTFKGSAKELMNSVWINPIPTNRSFFGLIWLLTELKIPIVLPAKPSTLLNQGEYDQRIFSLENVYIDKRINNLLPPASIHLPKQLSNSQKNTQTLNIIPITFNYYQQITSQDKYLFIPFGIHPEARKKGLDKKLTNEDQAKSDRIRIFCAGNLSYPEYQSNTIPNSFSILNRHDLIAAVVAAYPSSITNTPLSVAKHLTKLPICLIDQAKEGLAMEEYFATLDESTFLICPPGVNHPHCHNLYEGLSRGCIPILQYSHLVRPNLTPNVNCLSFDGKLTLADTLHKALTMPDNQIRDMQRNVYRYHNSYCNSDYIQNRFLEGNVEHVVLLNESDSIPS